MAGDGRRVARSRERVSEHSRVFGDVPDLPRHRDLCARHGARMIVPSASLFWSSASPERHAQSLAPSRPVARRVGLVSHIRTAHSGRLWPFQTRRRLRLVRCRLAAAATPGAHGTPPAQAAQNRRSLTLSESPRGLNPLNCCALALPRPLPHGPWPRYGMPYRMTYNGTEQSTSSPCVMDAIFMHG